MCRILRCYFSEPVFSYAKMKIMLDKGAFMPTRAHETDAGLDLYSREDKIIYSRQHTVWYPSGGEEPAPISKSFDTGVHILFDPGTYGKIESKYFFLFLIFGESIQSFTITYAHIYFIIFVNAHYHIKEIH